MAIITDPVVQILCDFYAACYETSHERTELIDYREWADKIYAITAPAKILVWGKTCEESLSWEEAKKWCKEQGGRLPTRVELLQAYEDKVEGFQSSSYWSATENLANLAWYVNFSTGNPATNYKNYAYSVRCVSEK